MLAIVVALIATFIVVRHATQPLLEFEAWRQTMTAITSYWMIHEGWQLAYQTPVLGYPWSIPIEAPIFQTIVAGIVRVGGFPLDPVGRLVSFSFLLACAWPARQIVRRLEMPTATTWLFCAFLWSSPLYLFFARNFLMETAAMFFAFAAIPYALDLRKPSARWSSVLLFVLFASLGLLQKGTTALPVMVIMGLVIVYAHVGRAGWQPPRIGHIVRVGVAFGIPVLLAAVWMVYTTAIKAENEIFSLSHSNSALVDGWLRGYGLRTDPRALKLLFWDRLVEMNAAGFLGLGVLAGSFALGDRRFRILSAVIFALLALPIFLTINQQHWLPYYQVASGVFLFAALAVSMTVALPVAFGRRAVLPFLAVLLVLANLYNYHTGYGRFARTAITLENSSTLAVSDVIRRYTPESSGIVVFGLVSTGGLEPIIGWSAEVAYYSQRKALTLPGWSRSVDRAWSDPASYLGDRPLGAIVFCYTDDDLATAYQRVLDRYSTPDSGLFRVGDCHLWLPDVQSVTLTDGSSAETVPRIN